MKQAKFLSIALSVFLLLMMTTNIFAAGGQNLQTQPAAQNIRKSFSILNVSLAPAPPPPDIDLNNNKWTEIFRKELPDTDIHWIIVPPDQLNQRVNILIGSGDFPDAIPMSMTQMIQWSEQGIIQPLGNLYQKSYPNIYNFMTDDDLKSTKYNGRQFGIIVPWNRLVNPNIMAIRTDWLENVKLPMPKTVSELYNVLRAFTFNDPDRNGQNDTYGVAGALGGNVGFTFMRQIFCAFGVVHGADQYYFSKVGNELIPDFIRPEMRDAVDFLARLYKEGIMDKDTLVMNQMQLEDKGVRGIVGLFGLPANGLAVRAYPNMLKTFPNAKVEIFIPPAAPDGNVHTPVQRNGGRIWGVSSRHSDPQIIVNFFNWMIGQDKSTLPLFTLNADKIYNGTIGIHSELIGNKFVVEIGQDRLSQQGMADLWRFCYRTHTGTMQSASDEILFDITKTRVEQGLIHPIFQTAMQFTAQYGKTNAVAVTGPLYAQYMADISTYWEETLATIISGAKPITAFDDFVKFFYANGGQRIIDEVTAMNR